MGEGSIPSRPAKGSRSSLEWTPACHWWYAVQIMPQCCRCNNEKVDDDFPWRTKAHKKRHSYCYECGRAYHREWYKRNKPKARARVNKRTKELRGERRKFVWDYLLQHPCVDCGESDPVVLDFDHVRGEKNGHVGTMVNNQRSMKVILGEIAKCEVRCANCHRRKTAKERDWYSSIAL